MARKAKYKMKNDTLKADIIQYVKDNPCQTSFDIRCGVSTGQLTEDLRNKVQSILARLVETNTFLRVPIDATKLHKGYYYSFNYDRIELGESEAVIARKNKADEKVDFVLNLIETNHGISSGTIRTKFQLFGHGSKNSVSKILEKLLEQKLIKRRAIQSGNPGAGYWHWPADAEIKLLPSNKVVAHPNRVPPPITAKLRETDPVAQFSATAPAGLTPLEELNSRASIEIAIRLCEIEAFRNPALHDQYMACAEKIRNVGLVNA